MDDSPKGVLKNFSEVFSISPKAVSRKTVHLGMIDTIIFDSEGVVIDTEAIWDKGQDEFLRRRGFAYDREKVKHLLTGVSLEDGVKALMREYGFAGNPAILARERLEIVAELIRRDVKFIDGFLDFFSEINGSFKNCIATAMATPLLEIVDKKLGLSKLFPKRIFSLADVGFRSKPHPDLFLYSARQLGSSSENCLVIEDAPFGLQAAKRAGMSCIAITTTYSHDRLSEADLVVDSFRQINVSKLGDLGTRINSRVST